MTTIRYASCHRTLAEQEADYGTDRCPVHGNTCRPVWHKIKKATMLTIDRNGTRPLTTNIGAFVYPDTLITVSDPPGLSPRVGLGTMGEGIDLFFMGGSDLDAIASLNRFVSYVTEYRDSLLAREARDNA